MKRYLIFAPVFTAFLGLFSQSSHARIGVLIFEIAQTISAASTNAGHAVLYMSGVCAETPTKARLCREGETGSIANRYPWMTETEGEKYAFVLSPVNMFVYGVNNLKDIPLIGGPGVREGIVEEQYKKFFSKSVSPVEGQAFPAGKWQTSVGTGFKKNMFLFSIESTREDDQRLVDALNAFNNVSDVSLIRAGENTFNLFLDNCSDFTRRFMNIALTGDEKDKKIFHRDWHLGLGMTTPKGLSHQMYKYAKKYPEAKLEVELFAQVPSTARRSIPTLYPMENSYRNILFLPWLAYFHPYIPGISYIWHEVLFPYSYREQYHKYEPGEIADRANHIDRMRAQLKNLKKRGAREDAVEALEKKLEISVADFKTFAEHEYGSKDHWKTLSDSFALKVKEFKADPAVPAVWKKFVSGSNVNWYHGGILKYLEKTAKFGGHPDSGGVVELQLPGDLEARKSSLSLDKVIGGDSALARLVLIAHLSYIFDTNATLRPPVVWVDHVLEKFEELNR